MERTWREVLLTAGIPAIAIVMLYFFGAHASATAFAILFCFFATLISLTRDIRTGLPFSSPQFYDAQYALTAAPAAALTFESLLLGMTGIDPLKLAEGLLK